MNINEEGQRWRSVYGDGMDGIGAAGPMDAADRHVHCPLSIYDVYAGMWSLECRRWWNRSVLSVTRGAHHGEIDVC